MNERIDEVELGGKYIGENGRYHDANGNDLGPVDDAQKEPVDDAQNDATVKKTPRK